jgi:hypothetical protein
MPITVWEPQGLTGDRDSKVDSSLGPETFPTQVAEPDLFSLEGHMVFVPI